MCFLGASGGNRTRKGWLLVKADYQAGDILYLYFPYAPNESIEIKGLKSRIKKVRVVGTDEELPWKLYNDIDWSAAPASAISPSPPASWTPA